MTTCRDALRAASGMLAQAGVPDPAVDAAFLLSHVTGTPHLLLRAEGWRELTQSQLTDYQALIDRRCRREPLQYILGTAQFMGVTLRAQPGALRRCVLVQSGNQKTARVELDAGGAAAGNQILRHGGKRLRAEQKR